VPVQTLSTCDFDELAEGFRRWELRFWQLGGGSFRGELKSQGVSSPGTRRHQAPRGPVSFAS